MAEPFEKKTYYAMTLDPMHVGTGGYRLGRVDNTIVREPGTNIPKIPGSSISGVTRAYTAMAVQSENPHDLKKEKYQTLKRDQSGNPVIKKNKDDSPKLGSDGQQLYEYYSCAGKGADDGEGHCGRPDCEVCVSFGFSKNGNSFQGLAQFCDARILFFPVHSMIGPVWVTCPSVLTDFKEAMSKNQPPIILNPAIRLAETDEKLQTFMIDANKNLNLGWLLLANKEKTSPLSGSIPNLNSDIISRLVLVPDKLFSRIVNDNLEVRTSVAIDPATGAAEHGALYTYEAIPRATVMWFDIVYNKPDYFRVDGNEIMRNPSIKADVKWIQNNVEKGLNYFESLGIGGMGTRGMGRMEVLNLGGQ